MRLLALDISLTATGVVDPDGNPDTLRPPKGMVGGERLAWWHQTFTVLLDQHQPTRIAVEAPYVGHRNNTLKLGELYGVFQLALTQHGRPIVITWVPPSSLKKAWTGSGNADKFTMRMAALKLDTRDDIDLLSSDAIDALALWHTTQWGMWDNPAGEPACGAPRGWPWGYLPCGCCNDGYGRHAR
jgi:Holliday junction resolvasome RuvABC endonuclease subunit